jgi:hypothetical protein
MNRQRFSVRLSLTLCAALFAATAPRAQQGPTQVLDRVDVHGTGSVLEMAFEDPNRPQDSTLLVSEPGAKFATCTLTATAGLYCLDGNRLRNWPSGTSAGGSSDVLNCLDATLGLRGCTGMTVDLAGNVWLAGQNKGRTHNLIKITPRPAGTPACPAGSQALAGNPALCSILWATGRPLLVDLFPIDGDVGAAFSRGSGIMAVQERKQIEFWTQPNVSQTIISGGKALGLQGNEQLLGATLLQIPGAPGATRSYALITTTVGRVIAATADASAVPATGFEVFNIPARRAATSTSCSSAAAQYGIRSSSKSGLVYATDWNYCQALALQPVLSVSGSLVRLDNAKESVLAGNPPAPVTRNITLSTGTYPPIGPTVAPGVAIDLVGDGCGDECPVITSPTGEPAVLLTDVKLANLNDTTLTIFQVKGIADCRWQNPLSTICRDNPGAIVNPGAPQAAQILNATPLLPRELTALFPQGLPPLLLPRWYRGQAANGYIFEALFAVTGATLTGVAGMKFNVEELAGSSLGCVLGYPPETSVNQLRRWDAVPSVSERFIGINGQHLATLINTGCGTSRVTLKGFSLIPYNTEISPDTYDPATGVVQVNDDAVFARLLAGLYDELGSVITQLACTQVDVPASSMAPVSPASCLTLTERYGIGLKMLDKCILATTQPKTSAGAENCGAFDSQLGNLGDAVDAIQPYGPDPANRKGELRARVDVVFHVFRERFTPSIPSTGFVEP